MTSRLSISGKILLLALANLLLLAAAASVFVQFQLGSGVKSILLGPASDKMMGLTARLTRDLEMTPEPEWDKLLEDLSAQVHARAYLIDPRGGWLAGPHRPVPGAVMERLAHGRPPPPASSGRERKGPPPLAALRAPPPIFLEIAGSPAHYWIGGRIRLPQDPRGGVLLLEVDSMFHPDLFIDIRLVAATGLTAVALCFLCWFSFVRRLTRAIRQMDSATERIAEGRFDIEVPVHRSDELGHLSSQINRMAGRLSSLVNGQKRFLGDIAHELCAPIARMQLALGILEQRSDDRGRESLADLREEVEHVSDLVNELLQFSKAAIRPGAVKVQPLAVAAAVTRVVARESTPGARVEVAVDPALHVLANEVYFTRALANLVRNSIRYAGHAGPIEVAARAEAADVVITVSDSGPGVEEDQLEKILDPFYRREESRSRESGGAGLGLAIVKAGIESCRGSVVCRNRSPHGLEVTLRLPAAPVRP